MLKVYIHYVHVETPPIFRKRRMLHGSCMNFCESWFTASRMHARQEDTVIIAPGSSTDSSNEWPE